MSKQLMLSATVSVLAMLALAAVSSPASADGPGLGASGFHAVANACASALSGELLPLLQPALQ